MRDNAILPPTTSGDGAGARCVSTAVQRRPAMKLGSASVRRCRLRLHLAAGMVPKRLQKNKSHGGVGFGGVGLELRRLY